VPPPCGEGIDIGAGAKEAAFRFHALLMPLNGFSGERNRSVGAVFGLLQLPHPPRQRLALGVQARFGAGRDQVAVRSRTTAVASPAWFGA
jgi:hypothetical protein